MKEAKCSKVSSSIGPGCEQGHLFCSSENCWQPEDSPENRWQPEEGEGSGKKAADVKKQKGEEGMEGKHTPSTVLSPRNTMQPQRLFYILLVT